MNTSSTCVVPVILASCLVVSTMSPAAFGAAPSRKPNVLFLAIDDLNDWMEALGGCPQANTPNLDRLFARSINFSNAHCAATKKH